MSRKKGHNVKLMDDLILVEGEEVIEWMKVRKKPDDQKPTPQQEKFKEFGRQVKESCSIHKGNGKAMRSCQADIRKKVFKKKSGSD